MKKALEKIKIARAYVEDNNKEYALLRLREGIAELQEASKAKDEKIERLKAEVYNLEMDLEIALREANGN